MKTTRRTALKLLSSVAPALLLNRRLRAQSGLEIQPGPFQGTRASLQYYEIPEWFRDAKFGIWAHWGPQSSVEQGDWYARNMYMQGSRQNQYHLATYGHPSKFGYKDLVPLWKAAEFDPEHLMGLYRRAGARYFMSMGVHHDNFDLWNSRHTRWNAVQMGPRRDVVGLWEKAARRQGLRFGVSEHLWISYKWFGVSHGSDHTGPLAGVAYDGVDPRHADLYHDAGSAQWAGGKFSWNADHIPDAWRHHWFLRIKDLVDQYQPDLLYTDGALPFEEVGCSAVANLYNLSARRHGGATQAVYTSKRPEDCAVGTCVLDFERGLANAIRPEPWQTDTCIGEWHYRRGIQYKSTKTVIDLLVDIVSQNGNLMLNFPLPNSGRLDPDEMQVLDGITAWMAVNSEGIHATRPWKIFGEGPAAAAPTPGAGFNEKARRALTVADVRFTTRGNTLYAFLMGWPAQAGSEAVIKALGTASPQKPARVVHVTLLGHGGRLPFTQEAAGLRVRLPAEQPSEHAIALKITLA